MPRPHKKQLTVKWNIVTGADAFGVSRDKLKSALTEAGIACGRGQTYSTMQIHTALSGSLRHETVLLKRAKRKLAELELKEKERELIPWRESCNYILDTGRMWREWVVSMPGRLAAQINPADPVHARKLLEQERDDFIALKKKLPVGPEGETLPDP